jgi:hypothetical protein
MTIAVERTRAVMKTEKFLIELCQHSDPQIRERAHSLLKHYPTTYCMELVARRDDGEDVGGDYKVFTWSDK